LKTLRAKNFVVVAESKEPIKDDQKQNITNTQSSK